MTEGFVDDFLPKLYGIRANSHHYLIKSYDQCLDHTIFIVLQFCKNRMIFMGLCEPSSYGEI